MDDLGYPHFTNPPYSWNFNDVLARGGSPASDKDLGERCASVARAEMGMEPCMAQGHIFNIWRVSGFNDMGASINGATPNWWVYYGG